MFPGEIQILIAMYSKGFIYAGLVLNIVNFRFNYRTMSGIRFICIDKSGAESTGIPTGAAVERLRFRADAQTCSLKIQEQIRKRLDFD